VDLIGHETVRFAMHPGGGFFVRRFDQARDRPAALVQPVLFVLDPILVLRLNVQSMGLRDIRRRCAVHLLVNIQIQWHFLFLLNKEY
jgi:hypothetical protein